MSFWPLPRSLTDPLLAVAGLGPCLELGAGRGLLARRLRETGVPVHCIDIAAPESPWPGGGALADMLRLPLADAAAGAVVLGNSLRHVLADGGEQLSAECWRVLVEYGVLAVLEDEPGAHSEAEANYRRTLELLCRVDPSRGPALSSQQSLGLLSRRFGAPELEAALPNQESIEDPELPLRWLRARLLGSSLLVELESLERSVRRHGMSYGSYWIQLYRRPAA